MPLPFEQSLEMGSPRLIHPKDASIIGEWGDIEKDNGARVLIYDGQLMFVANIDGTEMVVGMSIEHFLEELMEYNKKVGS